MSWTPNKVVVPIDFSEFSLKAAEVALEMTGEAKHVHLAHVLPELLPMEPGVIWGTIDDQSRADHARAALKEKLADPKFADCPIVVLFGDPAREVANYAQENGADLIVIPSHGRTGAARVLIGSVAERVVRYAHCPVLVQRS